LSDVIVGGPVGGISLEVGSLSHHTSLINLKCFPLWILLVHLPFIFVEHAVTKVVNAAGATDQSMI
jgi:hypothetical protein